MSRWPFRRIHPAAFAGRHIVHESLRRAAEDYVDQHLPVGARLYDGTDGSEIAAFRTHLPGALARRGRRLEELPGTPGGWEVVRTLPSPAECAVCHRSVFGCEHGVGLVIEINWEARW